MGTRCTVCEHKDRAAIEAAAKGAPSLDALIDVCAQHDVTRAAVERHTKKCGPAPMAKRRRGKAAAEEAPPDSGRHEVTEARGGADDEPASPPPPPRELGSASAELEALLRVAIRDLEHGGLTPTQRTQTLTSVRACLKDLRSLQDERPLVEHPDFDLFMDDVVGAVLDVLGPQAPAGTEARIAEVLFERQGRRLQAPALKRVA